MKNDRINALFRDFMRDLERVSNDGEARRAKEDPRQHRLTRVFEKPLSYRYFERKQGRVRERFCYSVNRNVAGYYLIWRERLTKSSGTRDQWDSTQDKRDAIATCRERSKQ